jgi:hypothetical protein
MTIPTLRRPSSAWRFVIEAINAVTERCADVADCDARVEALVADSAVGRFFALIATAWRDASRSSVAVDACRRAIPSLAPAGLADRLRAIGAVGAVAAATTLALQRLATEHDPLAWVLPAAIGFVAGLVFAGADRIARAIVHYRA